MSAATSTAKLDTLRALETPEGVALSLRVAGPLARGGAYFVDFSIRALILYCVVVVASVFGATIEGTSGLMEGLLLLLYFLLEWFYFVIFEVGRRQASPGKRVFGLRVVHRDGTPVGLEASILRNLLRTVDMLPLAYGVGIVSSLLHRDFARIGDRVAGTLVVHHRVEKPATVDDDGERWAPPVPLTAPEQIAVLDYEERLDEWTPLPSSGARQPAAATDRARRIAGSRAHRSAGAVAPPMSRERFVRDRSQEWSEFESLLDRIERRGLRKSNSEEAAQLPLLYRRLCQDLALSRRRAYGPRLSDHLNHLALRGHRVLHRRPPSSILRFLRFLAYGVPRLVRANAGLWWCSASAFAVPLLGVVWLAQSEPRWIEAVLGTEGAAQLGSMYADSAERIGRPPGGDTMMFGFYIQNNIGIDFRAFAWGVLGGVGTLFVLVFNGLHFGAATAHIHRLGYEETFYAFVSGHSAFEVVGMLLAGMGGLKLGLALIAPGRRTRGHALREDGRVALHLLAGGASLTFLAAFVEGFWSAGPASPPIKYTVGAALWLTTLLYLGFAGRADAR